jgi:hypothetical protein
MAVSQILVLEESVRFVGPDACGLQGIFDREVFCRALVSSLDAERIGEATAIGISSRVGVAQGLLQAYPERLEHWPCFRQTSGLLFD